MISVRQDPSIASLNTSSDQLFATTLHKPAGGRLGFVGMPVTVYGCSSILIRSIASGGAIDLHNRTCEPSKAIRPGDCIVRVGDILSDARRMMEHLVEAEEVQLCILTRALDSGLPSTPGCKESVATEPGHHDLSDASTTPPASNYTSAASSRTTDSIESLGHQVGLALNGSSTPEASAGNTTIVLRQLPTSMSREMLTRILNQEGFAGLYNFVYMPMKFGKQKSFSYAFVNLITPEVARACRTALEGYSSWEIPHRKACVTAWADSEQGLEANITRYRNSPVMHESLPDECKPALFKDGLRIPFPPPTKALQAPGAQKKTSSPEAPCPPEAAQLPMPAFACKVTILSF